ncbi:SGNH/GDSL hydrolase family protein [Actinoplanes sp. N902-109]|uniref:SGNH/GDSL hydrolase family protein n=1 Tax=Actinoplanes sp. (strain N902-109) TaxID=649831 RepID=UPI0003293ECD|nr:SGNH/GDSL hydrolase family protein [Actinoplanes sp. N902-109]AGL16780.1 lipase/acylhydrolase [Actinoplanes sp. N902-109]
MRAAILVGTLLLAGCASPPATPPTVVTLGDSVPAGTACGCDPFPVLYAEQQHATSMNLAVPGATSADVLAGLPAARGTLTPASLVLLMVGANDLAAAFGNGTSYATAAATVRDNVTRTITAIEAAHPVPVVVLGYWSVVRDGRAGRAAYGSAGLRAAAAATAAANTALRAAAQDTGARYLDTTTAFHGPDGRADPTGLLAPDGDHPDARGHAAIAALLPPLARP